ncbi:C4-dicarboxylate ABC transporter substrate-binding protein [Marinobacterium nitratireducens]|uniref:C4-dicarboxylate ABC transporter substrate-binding protein n=1 Tax=Marinobacterium nitratireducens TaxID=518897 RepID=A0A917ZJ46_9GAMM|nr:TAXI family TRAP transporter solute-binding subunit [Marinobacterium nitratireducens]GGO83482.1 C4-dicarboxylate ABC transporter substrate-binding protein [Marinobacterium nitratireducens]
MKKLLVSIGLLSALHLAASPASAENLQLDAGAASSVTGIVPQAMAQYTAREGIDLQVVLGQILTKSIMKVGAGRLESTLVPPPAFSAMKAGTGPYASQAEVAKKLAGNVRSLTSLPGSTYHAIAWADSGIETWDDIRGKRVFVGPPAGAANMQIIGMIEMAAGLEEGKDYEAIRAPWNIATQGFQDGQYDVLVTSAPIGQQSINELSLQREIRILGIPKEVTGTEKWRQYSEEAYMTTSVIPANTYAGQINSDQDLLTASNILYLGVGKDMDDDVAYRFTKAYWENIDEIKASNALIRNVNTDDPFKGVNAPLHPGAVRYYREAGISIPDALLPN